MKKHLYLLSFIILTSCNIGDTIKKREKINAELKDYLNDDNVNTSWSFGTDDENNYIHIDFTNYKFGTKTHQYLDSLSNDINNRIRTKFPEITKKTSIEVRYTQEEDIEFAKSFVIFRY